MQDVLGSSLGKEAEGRTHCRRVSGRVCLRFWCVIVSPLCFRTQEHMQLHRHLLALQDVQDGRSRVALTMLRIKEIALHSHYVRDLSVTRLTSWHTY